MIDYAGYEQSITCPSCGSQRGCNENTKKGCWHCFVCGNSGPATPSNLHILSPKKKVVSSTYWVDQLIDTTSTQKTSFSQFYPTVFTPPPAVDRGWHFVYDYCKDRGISDKDIEAYCLSRDRRRMLEANGHKLVIPIEGDLFVSRALDDRALELQGGAKYCISGKVGARMINFNHCSSIILCEGLFDVLALGKTAIGTLSSVPFRKQVQRLLMWRNKIKSVTVAYDSDVYSLYTREGTPRNTRSMMKKALDVLSSVYRVRLRVYHEGDPADHDESIEFPYNKKARQWLADFSDTYPTWLERKEVKND